MWALMAADEVRATASVAAVPKRTGESLRKILMVVPFNEAAVSVEELLGRSPGYGLLGPGALAQIRAEDVGFSTATVDQSNAFTSVCVPPAWHAFQAAPRVQARELPDDWVRGRWRPEQWVRPCYTRLAMGHTHAVFRLILMFGLLDSMIIFYFKILISRCQLDRIIVVSRAIIS